MNKKLLTVASIAIACTLIGTTYALNTNPRADEITNYAAGHTHNGDETHGAIRHSGGTDKYGCHNASVPYHCH